MDRDQVKSATNPVAEPENLTSFGICKFEIPSAGDSAEPQDILASILDVGGNHSSGRTSRSLGLSEIVQPVVWKFC